ncbi:Wzz/FepE/Etk N-terminal domain-containing protein [Paenisporosarcina quisquiliarum]|uniref:Wzz/FepE/Etk N-terminal domain-containing protein n=1 Tax=Paenisporosarcina quisquiliarum TaxID=365346 RepID=A0A9X3LH31_9BACL|nr:Wzz/FepE/Etk N-terminal domain-containing protein [Paenisporosarcina quisquiliarum]MCZ8537244.1 Wzz/FepE/Etk N-terminal domain-containing protein [Paenisporosarcina quisquiliarum]
MEETISLQELFRTLRKRMKLIVILTALAITISGVISFIFLTPIYQASTQILVNQEKVDASALNPANIQTDLQLINTYNVIIKSSAILDKVVKELDLNSSASELYGQITVNSEQNSQVVNITVQNENPKLAVEIANNIASVFQEQVKILMNVDNVNILAAAQLPENPMPVKPNPVLNMAIAAFVGLMLGVGLAFLIEYLDTTIKTEQDVEDSLGLPILGLISPIPDSEMVTTNQTIVQRRNRG